MDNAMIVCLVPACPGQVLVDLLRLPTATLPGASKFQTGVDPAAYFIVLV